MFWGLIMEPRRRYSQVVKKPFHISMAALDETTSDQSPVQVVCQSNDRNYLLCTLIKSKTSQVALDLNFEEGAHVAFAMNGTGSVHLTGYLIDALPESEYESSDGEAVEEEEEEEEIINSKDTKKKKSRTVPVDSPPKKKSKSTLEMLVEVSSNDEDDSEDSDVNMSDLMHSLDTTGFEEEADGLDDDDDEVEEEEEDTEGSDEDNEDDAEDEEGESESSLSNDEELQNATKPLENGAASRRTRRKIAQQVEIQQKSEKATKGDKTPGKNEKAQQKGAKSPTKVDSTPTRSKTPVKNEKTPGKAEKTPGKGEKTPKKLNKTPEPPPDDYVPTMRQLEGGVYAIDERVGQGAVAKPGKLVSVHYEGKLKSSRQAFDKSNRNGKGFQFRIGKQEVIKGWDIGVAGMRVGGKRRLVIPPAMAYGAKGSPPVIPPNSTLYFEIDLLNVKG